LGHGILSSITEAMTSLLHHTSRLSSGYFSIFGAGLTKLATDISPAPGYAQASGELALPQRRDVPNWK
jgi:hypothetical protein